MYTRVLVPLDRSPRAETILPHAQEIARRFEAELILLHVAPGITEVLRASGMTGPTLVTPYPSDPQVFQETLEAATTEGNRYLDEVAQRCRAADVKTTTVLAQGNAARAILQFCEDENVSLIAMCTHGHSGLARTLLGSVADEVMRESKLPVLLLRPE
jgi:nucleotide-binding universal stress UspA family protein